jgi:uncharacterized protein (TIGR00369 family)
MEKFFGLEVPFLALLGVHGERLEQGESELWLDLRDDLTNHFNTVHGGVVATMLDVAMSSAGRSLHPDALGVATVSLTTNFLRAPVRGRLVARGKVRQNGRSILFCESDVTDAEGKLVASAIGSFSVRRAAHAS